MTRHFHRDLENLNSQVLALSALAEEMIDMAARCLCESNTAQAEELIAADKQVDQREVMIEDECMKMLALHQPVALDLRRIATVMKINNDLERIGDLAVNIVKRSECLHQRPDFPIPPRLARMARSATSMVRAALNAYVDFDVDSADEVCRRDDEVDRINDANDGMDGLSQAQLRIPDLIVLDVMLPVMDGLEVCRRLRADPNTSGILVLMLTAKVEEFDQLVGFSVGADAYVTKPYSIRVLMQRIKALERRRSTSIGDADVVDLSDITVDRRRHEAVAAGRALNLTRSEFRLLDTLIRQPGRAFSRSELINSALGDDAIVLQRTIDVHITALRRKLGDLAAVIQTVRGVGYRFHAPRHDR